MHKMIRDWRRLIRLCRMALSGAVCTSVLMLAPLDAGAQKPESQATKARPLWLVTLPMPS
jgi:hypothetical protein